MNRIYNFFCLSILVLLISNLPAGATDPNEFYWSYMGNPGTLDIHVLSSDSSSNIFAGVWGTGIFKSTDDGVTWNKINAGLGNFFVNCIEIDKNGIIYAGTKGGGIYKSTNGGLLWAEINNGLDFKDVTSIAVTSGSYIAAGTNGGGVYISTNYGAEWTNSKYKLWRQDISAVVIAPDTSLVVGTFGAGIFKSTNRGESWYPVSAHFKSKMITDIVINELGALFAAVYGEGIYISAMNGSGWQKYFGSKSRSPYNARKLSPLGLDDMVIATDTSGAMRFNILYAGVPGDSPWIQSSIKSIGVTAITVAPNGKIYAARAYGGIFRSDDGGEDYVQISKDFETNYPYGTSFPIVTVGGDIYTIPTSSQKGIYRSTDKGFTWELMGLENETINDLIFKGGKLYTATDNGPKYSDDFGANWNDFPGHSGPIYAININSQGHIFITDSALRISYNNGATFSPVGIWVDQERYHFIVIDSKDYVYVNQSDGESLGFYRTTNNGNNWQLLIDGSLGYVSDFKYRNNKYYAKTDEGIFLSSTGTGFVLKSPPYAAPVVKAHEVSDNGTLFIVDPSKHVVLQSRDDGTTWDSTSRGVFSASPFDMATNDDKDMFICYNSFFRGISGDDLEIPTLKSPINDEGGFALYPELEWNPVENSLLYEMQLSNNPGFTEILEQCVIAGTKWGITWSLDYGTKYFWRVRSKINKSTSAWSETGAFYTIIAPPELIFPPDSSYKHDTDIAFEWAENEDAAVYHIQASADESFANIIFEDESVEGATASYDKFELDRRYYWRVKAKSFLSDSEWSDVWEFNTKLREPLLRKPNNDTVIYEKTALFVWDTVPNATKFDVQISLNEDFTDIVYEGPSDNDTSFNYTLLEFGNKYYWRVKAKNDNNESSWSESWAFSVQIPPVVLLSPEDGSTGNPPDITFEWEASPLAEFYEFQLAKDIEFGDIVESADKIAETSVLVESIPYGAYYWRVRYAYGETNSPWAEPWMLGVDPGKIILLLPEDKAENVSVRPEIKWDGPKLADSYRLQVADSEDFSNILIDMPGLMNKSFYPEILEKKKTYYWRVNYKYGENESGWSQVWSFTTGIGFTMLIAPENGKKEAATTLTFRWATAEYADKYQLQVSSEQDFSAVEYDKPGLEGVSFEIIDMDTGKAYYWRVKIFEGETEGEWSDVWSFTTRGGGTSVDDYFANIIRPEIYPNPANDESSLSFNLDKYSRVDIEMIEPAGRRAARIFSGNLVAGKHEFKIDYTGLSAGAYYLIITINGKSYVAETAKIK